MEEHSAQPVFLAVFATALIGFVFIGSATCGSKRVVPTVDASVERVTDAGAIGVADASAAPGISAPIAATRVEGGDVVVVALDVAAKGVRAFRIGPDDTIKVGGRYENKEGKITSVEAFISQTAEADALRKQTQAENIGWYAGITADIFG